MSILYYTSPFTIIRYLLCIETTGATKYSSNCVLMIEIVTLFQGEIELPHPRLSVDFPIIMCEVTKS